MGVVEEPGQRVIGDRDIDREDRHPHRCVGPVPLDDPIEEAAQHPEPLTDRVACRRDTLDGEMGGEEQLEPFDMGPADVDEPDDLGVGSTRNPAKQRSVLSATSTVAGRIDTAS